MISVCIPTYNGEKYIRKQLDSILPQLSEEDEVIISDDSSTDNTCEIIKSYSDSRIHLMENQHFKSPIFNLENALKHSKGEYVFLSDQDDIWHPNKIEKILVKLATNNLVVSNAQLINDKDDVIHESVFELYKSGSGFFKNLFKNTYIGCTMAFDRKLLKFVLPFPKGIAMHDSWIGLNAELLGNIAFTDDVLMQYRRHDGNKTTTKGEKSGLSWGYKIQYRIQLLFLVLWNYVRIKTKL